MDGFAPFGEQVTADDLAKNGLDIEYSPTGLVRIGNCYEAPCSLKTTIKEIFECGSFSYVSGRGRFSNVHIGRYCSIAEGVSVGYPEHPTGWLSTSALQYMRPPWTTHMPPWQTIDYNAYAETIIGNDVWIGAHAFIRAGVAIGTGAVVGAHSVVTKDVDPYTVVAGSPARVIRARLPSSVAYALEDLSWWEFSPTQLDGCPFDSPPQAVDFIKKLRDNGVSPFSSVKLIITGDGARLA